MSLTINILFGYKKTELFIHSLEFPNCASTNRRFTNYVSLNVPLLRPHCSTDIKIFANGFISKDIPKCTMNERKHSRRNKAENVIINLILDSNFRIMNMEEIQEFKVFVSQTSKMIIQR